MENGQLEVSRRDFVRLGAFLGASVVLGTQVPRAMAAMEQTIANADGSAYPLSQAERQLYTVCLQCNTGCGVKVKLYDGVAVKIDGNPYSPWTMTPHVPYATSPFATAAVDTAICPKGQAGIQSVYDPYRIVKVLKRAGKRGEGKWQSVPFEQALNEIVEGGLIFKQVSGEESRQVTGLEDICALRDPAVAKALAADAGKVAKKQMTLEEFKAKYKDNLDKLIDPDHPDLGPRNNQFVFAWGRMKAGRSDFVNRFVKESFGSTNAHGHTTVCQGSLYFTGKAMSEQYTDGKWTGGKKFYWQADTGNAEFIIFVGASPFEGNYGPPLRSGKVADNLVSGKLKMAVVDPRLSKTAAKAWKWLPIRPGTEGAMALALIRWVIDNKRYDERFLKNANKAAATADKEPSWSNAAWLVKIDKDGTPGKFLRGSEAGFPKEKRKAADGTEYDFDPFVVLIDGKPVAFDPYDDKVEVHGDLLVNAEVNGIKIKSGLQVLSESAANKTVEEWAKECDLQAADLVELAREFTSHGKKAVADVHRGVSQHTNGFYNVFAWLSLNLLIGNYDWKGGMCQLATYDQLGTKEGKPFNLSSLHNKKTSVWGLSIIRHDAKYEETTIFADYPAKRPFYPLSSDVYQEIVPSLGDAYPYPVKALLLYMGSPVYSLPAGNTNIDILSDPAKLPLFIASDIVIGETSMYADYIFPDLSFLERWEFHGSHPSIPQKVQPVRQPVIAPLIENVKVYGQEVPCSLEALLMGLAEKLKLPGFGKDGFGTGKDFLRPEDYYLRMVANLAFGDKEGEAVPDADDREVKVFLDSRKHLPKTVFDADYWKAQVGDAWWRKAIYVLNRGGRFDDYEKGYDGDRLKNKYGTLINLYQEKTATTKHSMTGKPLAGYPTYLPAPADCLGRPIADDGYDLRLITYREIAQTKSRTSGNYWLLSLLPENFVLMNQADADRLGLRTDDSVRVVSPTNQEGVWDLKNGTKVPMVGKVKVIQGIRPGVIAFSLGHGHWAYGGKDLAIDGQVIKGDARRIRGIHANAAMRIDPYLKNTTLVDVYGGSAVFYDSQVKVIKV